MFSGTKFATKFIQTKTRHLVSYNGYKSSTKKVHGKPPSFLSRHWGHERKRAEAEHEIKRVEKEEEEDWDGSYKG
jgi:hypothetical protein